ncbi:MAG: low molecular weight phosphatase family protein [Candidatus Paceibacterota bacterium]
MNKAKKIEVVLEFLIFGIVIGVVEDVIAVKVVTGEPITWGVIGIVVLIAIPFAIIGEIFADNVNFTKHIRRWLPADTVLFACAENSKRSQLAEAIFNHYASSTIAMSAGTIPADQIDPRVPEVLKEVGITDVGPLRPKLITTEMIERADKIISFGCLVPSLFPEDKFSEWLIGDPQTDEELREVRDELLERIKRMIEANEM